MSLADRVDETDWDAAKTGLDAVGCALTGPLLTAAEAGSIAALYPDEARFLSTIDMGRYRFGEGQYRYFAHPYPDAVAALKRALYPRLLPIARDWWARLGRDAPWPDDLDDWLRMCHAAGHTRSTALLLKYQPGDWNALHRDLYGELVFPLQVVINLNDPGVEATTAVKDTDAEAAPQAVQDPLAPLPKPDSRLVRDKASRDRAAQRPSSLMIGSASRPQGVSP